MVWYVFDGIKDRKNCRLCANQTVDWTLFLFTPHVPLQVICFLSLVTWRNHLQPSAQWPKSLLCSQYLLYYRTTIRITFCFSTDYTIRVHRTYRTTCCFSGDSFNQKLLGPQSLSSEGHHPGHPSEVGELLVLPVVAFGCLLPLGRLLCCLAEALGFSHPECWSVFFGKPVGLLPWLAAISSSKMGW